MKEEEEWEVEREYGDEEEKEEEEEKKEEEANNMEEKEEGQGQEDKQQLWRRRKKTDFLPSRRSSMSNVCTLCSGPIELADTHEFCILCLGLAHAEAALNGSSCLHCEEFSRGDVPNCIREVLGPHSRGTL
ncbi:hypothetical protein G5714_015890 [Onychostoma macrolepis]|uniref:Uncharacterized protein n=1 Tax=Onychostoma macrolepis TaxID=369639 RepID=A0A7J6C6T8_9TELE|nr:hypothetical protein G5714_015890 [Onychostoma macrolepis]